MSVGINTECWTIRLCGPWFGAAGQRTCAYCKGPHSPSACDVIITSQARKDFIVEHKLCFNCLGRHKVSACTSRHRCHKCQRKHHTSLCSDTPSGRQQITTATNAPPTPVTNTHVASSGICLLKTAVAAVSSGGTCVNANILFDEGSQRSFISKGLANFLQVQPHRTEHLSISTFGAQTSHTSQFEAAVIHLHTISGKQIPITVLSVPTIAVPICNVNHNSLSSFHI